MPTCRAGRMGRVARCTYRPIHSKLRPSQFRDEPGGDGLYVLAAAIPNLVRAGSVPCYAALPHPSREWQYARTRPAHRSNANSVLYALVMETLNWNRWWYPRTRTRWAAAAPDASGRRSWAHTHSDISRSCAQMRRRPPGEALRSPTIPGHLGMHSLRSGRRQHHLSLRCARKPPGRISVTVDRAPAWPATRRDPDTRGRPGNGV